MLLNNQEIIDRIFKCKGSNRHLSIVPEPAEPVIVADGGASLNLHLGRWFRTMKQSNTPFIDLNKEDKDIELTKEIFIPFKRSFFLHPGKFVLGITLEWIALPGDISAVVSGKSSLGRRGLIIETSSGIHPGFAGCLTLELANVGEIPVALSPGMEICQIFLHETSSHNANASSQFKGRRKPGLGTIKRA